MNKSIVLSALFQDTVDHPDALLRALDMVEREQFYDTVEFYYEGAESRIGGIRSALDRFPQRSVFLGGTYLKRNRVNLGSLDAEHRRRAQAAARALVDRAYKFGSGKLLVTSGENYASRAERSASFDCLAQSLIDLCAYAGQTAERHVLTVTLEHFNDRGEPFYLIGPSPLAKRLADIVTAECANFEITFDLSHAIQLGEPPADSLAGMAQHVNHIHLANCYLKNPSHPMFGDKHPPFDYPDGEVRGEDLARFLGDIDRLGLLRKGSDLTVGVEVIAGEAGQAAQTYRQTTDLFKSLLSQLP